MINLVTRQLRSKRTLAVLSVILLVLLGLQLRGRDAVPPAVLVPTVSFNALASAIKADKVTLLTVNNSESLLYASMRGGQQVKVGIPSPGDDGKVLLALGRKHDIPSESALPAGAEAGFPYGSMLALLPLLLLVALVVMMMKQMRGGRGMKIAPVGSGNVHFSDIAGCGEVVQELAEIRDFLANPKRYSKLGARVPKGVLLYGPPGTGKTLVARAIASEAGIPFYSVSGSEFVEMYVGLGAARVRKLFKAAKKNAPAIIFIDELDAVGRKRGGEAGGREADQTLNQLLVEMDGFTPGEHPLIVIAASNRLEDLDPALLRPGRFDRHLAVDPPDRKGRLEILLLHAKGKALATGLDLEALADKTSGMSGAELANILNEATLFAARREAAEVSQDDLDEGFVRVIAGARKQNRSLSERERKIVAYHEAGHALAAELLDSPSKVQQISIAPRGSSAGHMIHSDEEEILLQSRSQLDARIVCLLAGRAAEEIVVGDVTTGAGNDLERASQICTAMLSKLGMGSALGLSILADGKDLPVAAQQELKQTLAGRYQEAKTLLEQNWPLMDTLAGALLAEETIERKRFLELLAQDAAA